MTSLRTVLPTAACLLAMSIAALSFAPTAIGDPELGPQPLPPPAEFEVDASPSDAALTACDEFAGALDVAALNYSDFADLTSGDQWSYRDVDVASANVTGRTALRQAVATATKAAATPGLEPQIANPMRAWAIRATKLMFVMGLRGSNDWTNDTADQLNDATHDAQMACAAAGTHA